MPSVPLQAGIEIVDLSSRTPIIVIITNGGELCCSSAWLLDRNQDEHFTCVVVADQSGAATFFHGCPIIWVPFRGLQLLLVCAHDPWYVVLR